MGRWRRDELESEHREAVRIAAPERTDMTAEDVKRYEMTKGGDPREARGIPLIAHGVAGHISESSPHLEAEKLTFDQ